jgi:hypothetical protein
MNPKMMTGICTKCGVEGKIRGSGLCVKDHAEAWREMIKKTPCKVEGCERGCKSRMMCDLHYSRYIRSQKSRSANQAAVRAIANEEKNRIVLLLRKYGQHRAADIVAVSTSTVGL